VVLQNFRLDVIFGVGACLSIRQYYDLLLEL